MKKEIIKTGVIFLLTVLLVASAAYAEKFSGKGGALARFDNITGFIQERTSAILKADIRDGHGRIYVIIKSQSKYNDKIEIRIDLRNPIINESTNETSGYASISYKATNNGYFVVDPVPNENGYFHKIRIGAKPPIKEKEIEHVVFTRNENDIDIHSNDFEFNGIVVKELD